MENTLVEGTKVAQDYICEQTRKWWNSTAEYHILRCSTVLYNDNLNTIDIVFNSRVKLITLWINNGAKDYDISTVLPNNVRFVFANPNHNTEPIIVEVLGKGEWEDKSTYGNKFNGWKRIIYGDINITFPHSNCSMIFI